MSKIKFFSSFQGLCLVRVLAFISVLIGLILGLNHSPFIEAKTIAAGVLKIEYPDTGALFSASNLAPGYEETKTLKVTNLGTLPHSFSIAVSGTPGILADVLEIEPKINSSVVWTKTIANIAKFPQSDLIISSIAPGSQISIDITARLPLNVGNAYQGQVTSAFDFVLGNESTDQPEPGPTPIVPSGPIIIPAVTGPTPVAPTVTPPSVTPPKGEKKGVAEEGQAKGVEEHLFCWWWLILSIILAVFLGAYGYVVYKREIQGDQAIPVSWLWPFVVAVAFYIIHLIIHRYLEPSKWCPYFPWIELGELALFFGTIYYLRKREEDKKETI